MKRHETLIPLTHDHHHALAQIRRLRVAANGTDEDRQFWGRQFQRFFHDDTIKHFREEEEIVFPLVVEEPEARDTLDRAMCEHLVIHAAVHSMERELEDGAPRASTLLRVVDLLQGHIRFEEKTVFPLIESLAGEASLASVTLSPRNRAAV
ncbi:MAG: hypothetical protein QOH26_685 [Actinomycetota bacterium]|nr:hypothetical protein [Actinomycetota bacterium]